MWFTGLEGFVPIYGEAPRCDDCSLGGGLRGLGADLPCGVWQSSCCPSQGGGMRASASSSRGSVGGPSFSAFLQLCVYSLRYSCLFCVTRALGMTRNLPPSVKPPLTERIFRKAAYREVTGDFRRDTQKWQNVKQRSPLGFGILNHWLLPIKEGSVCYKLLPHRTSTHVLHGVSRAHFQREVFRPVVGQESVARKHSVVQRMLGGWWNGRGSADQGNRSLPFEPF